MQVKAAERAISAGLVTNRLRLIASSFLLHLLLRQSVSNNNRTSLPIFVSQPLNLVTGEHYVQAEGVYADRTAGGDCHYWHPYFPSLASCPKDSRGRGAHELLQ